MNYSEEDLKRLLSSPREAFDLELKQWIDPQSPEGIGKIAKCCIAMRNNNGGRLIIGFKDDGQPDLNNVPEHVSTMFSIDIIQGIVAKYSSEPFEVNVQFVEMNGQKYPVITVPDGVKTPVVAKSDLRDPNGRKKNLIKDNSIYVRSLNSNNTVSSTEARRGDWERLVQICFDNREADIGAFVRRHLAAPNRDSLFAAMKDFFLASVPPSDEDRVAKELEISHKRFLAAAAREHVQVPQGVGFREAIALVDNAPALQSITPETLQRLFAVAPRHTGWPPWANLSNASDPHLCPYVVDGGWESILNFVGTRTGAFGPSLDFWRIGPPAVFYHIRALEGDFARPPDYPYRKQLDFYLQIARVAEIISTGLSFGRSLGCDAEKTSLVFGFRWKGLLNRDLASIIDPQRWIPPTAASHQDEVVTVVRIPLETPPTGIAPHVEKAVADLFMLFGGMQFESSVVEKIVNECLSKR